MRGYITAVKERIADNLVLGTVMSTKRRVIKGKVIVLTSDRQAGPGKSASIQLYSATELDPGTGRGRLTEKASLEHGKSRKDEGLKTVTYQVKVRVGMEFGIPGAILITNKHKNKFFLESASFQVPGIPTVHFDCNSWVYPIKRTDTSRIFFSNTSYLPSQTPAALDELRREELNCLRGNGTGERKEWDRIYDYDYYNDLGDPDKGEEQGRPVLGGNASYPYPRRLRTGRPRTETDPSSESNPGMLSLNIVVPPDEQPSPRKLLGLLSDSIQSLLHFIAPGSTSLFQGDSSPFDSFDEILGLFSEREEGRSISGNRSDKKTPRRKKQKSMKFPLPRIIAEDRWAWQSDAEFARQMLAGTNPVRIRCLQEFPPSSETGAESSMTEERIEPYLEGLTLEQAMLQKRMFILDHHDYLVPCVYWLNWKDVPAYASRTLLFLRDDSTVKPVAIELTLLADLTGTEVNWVFFPVPASQGDSGAALWQLAKAHVAANDSAYHHLISHWLHTHAVVEPFIIATRRQLSKMHPIHRLLDPHLEDTLHVNALARRALVNAGGILETALFTGEVSMELSSMLYKEWRFDEQGLPSDLLKRGMAIDDPDSPAGVRLLLKDYPCAADGLEVWTALKTWITDYCSVFYRGDGSVGSDEELQAWWWEVRNVGHGDKKDETWWSDMATVSDLIEALTTLIWTASAFHASVASGMYSYSGFPPNRPGLCKSFVPDEGTLEFASFLRDPDGYYLGLLPGRAEMTLMVALTEFMSSRTSNEVCLGQRRSPEWTDNEEILQKFEKFKQNLRKIEGRILERNKDPNLKNRHGPAEIPYEVLRPAEIPNSISI